MLYPRINKARTVMDLAGLWEFKLGDANRQGIPAGGLQEGSALPFPPLIMIRRRSGLQNHYGWAWYERDIAVPALFLRGQRLFLRFDAVTHKARIYLNGRLAMEHKGGISAL